MEDTATRMSLLRCLTALLRGVRLAVLSAALAAAVAVIGRQAVPLQARDLWRCG